MILPTVYVSPADVWTFYQENIKEIKKSPSVIAEWEEYGIVVFLSCRDNHPCFEVYADNYSMFEGECLSEWDTEETLKDVISQYMTGKLFENICDDAGTEVGRLIQEDLIYERETALDDAISDFMGVVLDEGSGYAASACMTDRDRIYDDIKEHMLEYIARKHEIDIYRPMVLEDEENGGKFFAEYPYECMVFEDESNPIYK